MESRLSREIAEQPALWESLIARAEAYPVADRIRKLSPPGLATVARGSSDHAATYLAYLAGLQFRLPVASIPPSMVTLHGAPPRVKGWIAFGISQSGRSPDVIAAFRGLKSEGAYAIAITDDPSSPLAEAADSTIALATRGEGSVAATKTFTATLLVSAMLIAEWGGNRAWKEGIAKLPELGRRALEDPSAIELARRWAGAEDARLLGRGPTWPLALEGALKLKEVAGLPAEGASAAEFLHGPLAAVAPGSPALLLAPPGPDGSVFPEVSKRLASAGADVFSLPAAELPAVLSPLPMAIWLQRLAVALALARGRDPDAPPHIEKISKTW